MLGGEHDMMLAVSTYDMMLGGEHLWHDVGRSGPTYIVRYILNKDGNEGVGVDFDSVWYNPFVILTAYEFVQNVSVHIELLKNYFLNFSSWD